MDVRGLSPAGPVKGTLRPPGSKSIAQRVLVAALCCPEPTEVRGLPDGDDVRATLALLVEAGADVERLGPGCVRVTGPGPAGLAPSAAVAVGESGTLARFATAVLALCRHSQVPVGVQASGSLLRRRSDPLFTCLRAAGARLDSMEEQGSWPVRVHGTLTPDVLRIVDPVSSQEVSALWIAAAAQPKPVALAVEGRIPSAPYLELTRSVLERYGARIEARELEEATGEGGARGYAIRGPLRAPDEPFEVEADASSAAVALAAACLSAGDVRVVGIPEGTRQGDVRVVTCLAAFGCEAGHDGDGLVARGFPARGATLDLGGEPDLAPVLAAVAAGAARRHGVASRLTGLGALSGKESDRIAVLAEGLERCGFTVAATSSSLEIAAGRKQVGERIVLDPHGDHRMAFAFALVGLFVPHVLVRDPGCVAKSWPGFWDDLAALGAGVVGS